jgi:hypothetical protein
MDAQLSGEKIAEERAFVKRYADGLGNRSVEYGADYTAPLSDRPRKVTVIGVSIVFVLLAAVTDLMGQAIKPVLIV